nr:MAG TPA: hypothetical protein [Caudoviricetes sp.]
MLPNLRLHIPHYIKCIYLLSVIIKNLCIFGFYLYCLFLVISICK